MLSRWMLAAALVVMMIASSAAPCREGGQGQGKKVLLVVNSNSWASLTVANQYVALRGIPESNIVAIPFELARKDDTTDIDTFREKILSPVLKHIAGRKLSVDYIVYSSDFPTAVDFGRENKFDPENKDDNHAHRKWPVGSINGLTFLYQPVLAKDVEAYLDPHSNRYFRQPRATDRKGEDGLAIFDPAEPLAFSSASSFDEGGSVSTSAPAGRRYYISTVLGLTSGRGNSVKEVIDSLRRAAGADGTNPDGAFYYMYDDGIRTKTRYWCFASAIASLDALGRRGELIRYVMPKDLSQVIAMPKDKDDIVGAMLGQQFPNCVRSGSKTMPGAIVENFTSEGGIMNWGGGQVPISEFIRFGAAGTSGTVSEPTALQWKFPNAFLFYYYARGATLGEAFYQSVSGPYQLLIVGDPLCRPFRGKSPAENAEIAEGAENAENAKAGELTSQAKEVAWGKKVSLRASVPGAKKVEIVHLGRVVAEISGSEGGAEIEASALGMGPARLYARAAVGDRVAMSSPLTIEVKAPQAIPAGKAEGELSSGALISPSDGSPVVVTDMRKRNPLIEGKFSPGAGFTIVAILEAPADDVYQVQVWYDGPLSISIDSQPLADLRQPISQSQPSTPRWRFIPISLAKGTHQFAAKGTTSESREIDIRFGGPGSRSLGDKNSRFRSASTQPGKMGTP